MAVVESIERPLPTDRPGGGTGARSPVVCRRARPSRLNPRGARGTVGVETTTSRVVRGHFHVRPELVFQVGVAPVLKQRSLKTLKPFANDAHAISLTHASPCSSVWMMPAIWSHAGLSSAS